MSHIATTNDEPMLLAMDSGGTKTAFRLLDRTGRIYGESRSGGVASIRSGMLPVKEYLQTGLSALPSCRIKRAYFSLGGPNEEEVRTVLQELLPETEITLDREANGNMILTAAALYRCTAAVMVGTGSVAVGVRGGKRVFSGGWGPALDDAGAGGFLGLEALKRYLFDVDRRRDCGRLREMFATLSEGLDVETFSGRMELKRRANELTRSELAAFVPEICRLAEEGCTVCTGLLSRCAGDIAELAASVAEVDGSGVLGCGGMFQISTAFRRECQNALSRYMPGKELKFFNGSGMTGCAAIMVLRAEGITDHNILWNQIGEEE